MTYCYYSDFHIAPQSSAAKPQGTAARAPPKMMGTAAIFAPESIRAPKSVFKNIHFWQSSLDRRKGTGRGIRGDGRKIKRPT